MSDTSEANAAIGGFFLGAILGAMTIAFGCSDCESKAEQRGFDRGVRNGVCYGRGVGVLEDGGCAPAPAPTEKQ